ncbi:MAG: iron ABC transporter permease [Planctomycetes bacterium]|nr:iron ABC transporter permease [Planctomycetota bacterium]
MSPQLPPPPRPVRPGRVAGILAAILAVLVLLCAARLFIGTVDMGWPGNPDVLAARETRLICGVMVGAALAISGVMLQALLRNPLAEPFILGLTSGAGLGVMVHTLVTTSTLAAVTAGGWLATASQQTSALIGAGASMLIVFLAARRRGTIDPLGLLLVGVVLSAMNGAIILVLQYFADAYQTTTVSRWMMGWINEGTTPEAMWFVGLLLAAGLAIAVGISRAMDVATFSDAEAQSLGVNLRLLRVLMLGVSAVLAAASVVLTGPVSFVGLIAPHFARLIMGPAHRPVVLASAMIGAMLILLADIAATLIAYRFPIGLMPIGVFTALLGGAIFLWMLRPQLGRGVE